MKKIELKELELTNYRNIDHLELEFDGNSKIIGENRIGKTNVLEAIYWLLTDKLLDCSTNIALIKPLDDTKKEVRVKGTFLIDNALEITLEKQYGEDWVTTRGTTEQVFKGHYCKYIYNDVPCNTLKLYNGYVAQDFGINANTLPFDVLQMLVNPFYLGNMGESDSWKNLRQAVISLVGDVTDKDVLDKYPTLSLIAEDINNCNGKLELLKKKIDSEITGLKDNINVDEAQIKLLEETNHPTQEELAIAKKGLEECEERIALINNPKVDTVSQDLQQDINKLESEMLEKKKSQLENSDIGKLREDYTNLLEKKNKTQEQKNQVVEKIISIKAKKRELEYDNNFLNSKRNSFLEQLKDIDDKIKNVNVETECPLCHRPYDSADIEEHRKQAISDLESKKLSILSQGKENKAKLSKNNEEIDFESKEQLEQEKLLEDLNTKLDAQQKELDELLNKISLEQDNCNNNESDAIKDLEKLISEKKSELVESKNSFYKGQQDTRELIDEEKAKAEPFKKVIADNDFYVRQMENLEKVREQKVAHTKELANYEQKRELLKVFTIKKLEMLDENVSRVFGNIRFQLIKENINGGFDTICKPYIYDIEHDVSTKTTWKSGSKSERVITGIAIAEAIKSYLNLPNLPYLFDEGGEISTETFKTKFKTDSQIICVKIVDNLNIPTVERI